MLLAIDTSAGTSVAVVDRDRVLSEASAPGTCGHAELIGTKRASQVNVIRSSNSGLDRIAFDDGWEGEWFPLFPLLPLRH